MIELTENYNAPANVAWIGTYLTNNISLFPHCTLKFSLIFSKLIRPMLPDSSARSSRSRMIGFLLYPSTVSTNRQTSFSKWAGLPSQSVISRIPQWIYEVKQELASYLVSQKAMELDTARPHPPGPLWRFVVSFDYRRSRYSKVQIRQHSRCKL